jgi:hypothetical protein
VGTARLVIIASLASGTAFADDARDHFEAGQRAFDAHDYATASRDFEQAYASSHAYTLLYSWAQAERLGGRCEHAIELYQHYLASDGVSPTARDTAQHWIDACEATLPRPWYRDRLGDGLAIGGGVALVTGIAFLAVSGSRADDATRAPTLDAHDRLVDAASRDRTIGGIAVAAGVALAGAAVYVYITHDRAAVTSDGHAAMVTARF